MSELYDLEAIRDEMKRQHAAKEEAWRSRRLRWAESFYQEADELFAAIRDPDSPTPTEALELELAWCKFKDAKKEG